MNCHVHEHSSLYDRDDGTEQILHNGQHVKRKRSAMTLLGENL